MRLTSRSKSDKIIFQNESSSSDVRVLLEMAADRDGCCFAGVLGLLRPCPFSMSPFISLALSLSIPSAELREAFAPPLLSSPLLQGFGKAVSPAVKILVFIFRIITVGRFLFPGGLNLVSGRGEKTSKNGRITE